MAAKLKEIIPPQKYEIIRDLIGVILAEEMAEQFSLVGAPNNKYINPPIFQERIVPFSHAEGQIINVKFAGGEYQTKSRVEQDGTYTYFIDVYISAQTEGESPADNLANVRLQRTLGIIRAILENPVYDTLGLERPSITRSSITNINMADPEGKHDATTSIQGRATFSVEAPESVQLIEAVELDQSRAKLKLAETDKGYQYIA